MIMMMVMILMVLVVELTGTPFFSLLNWTTTTTWWWWWSLSLSLRFTSTCHASQWLTRVSTLAWLGRFAKISLPSTSEGDVAQQDNQQYWAPASPLLADNWNKNLHRMYFLTQPYLCSPCRARGFHGTRWPYCKARHHWAWWWWLLLLL